MPMIDLAAVGERRGPEVPTGVGRGGRNDALFRLAASLRARGYGDDELLAELFAANATFDPPLPDREVVGRARSVLRYEPGTSSGAVAGRAVARQARESWSPPLVARVGRPERFSDKSGMSPVEQARMWVMSCFDPEDVVCLCTRVRGHFPRSEWYAYAGQLATPTDPLLGRMVEAGSRADGLFAVVNPMRDDASTRTNADVARHRNILVESDEMAPDEQLERMAALLWSPWPRGVAITWSGGKSYHCVVRRECRDEAHWRAEAARLYAFCEANGLAVDRQCGNPARLTRVPGSVRRRSPQRLVAAMPPSPAWSGGDGDGCEM